MRLVIYLVSNCTTVRFGTLNPVEHLSKNAKFRFSLFVCALVRMFLFDLSVCCIVMPVGGNDVCLHG